MAQFSLRIIALIAMASFVFFTSAGGKRSFNRRSDLIDIPPLSLSGYTVPLQGAETCVSKVICNDTLPAPLPGKSLKVLTIARGVLTYDCTNVDPTDLPIYVSQTTQLYDVAPLIALLPNEEALHQLVPEFYNYDYAQLDNSTLVCLGGIYTENGCPLVVLDNIATFSIQVELSIAPPEVPGEESEAFNAYWAYSTSLDGAWEVYRVETVGGALPIDCNGRNSTFELGYAAEYWFYHA